MNDLELPILVKENQKQRLKKKYKPHCLSLIVNDKDYLILLSKYQYSY